MYVYKTYIFTHVHIYAFLSIWKGMIELFWSLGDRGEDKAKLPPEW